MLVRRFLYKVLEWGRGEIEIEIWEEKRLLFGECNCK